jgi:hypothetical protein
MGRGIESSHGIGLQLLGKKSLQIFEHFISEGE